MKKKLDDALCRDFPNLYRDRRADMRVTGMCWGFPSSGWEPLIRELSEKLEKLIVEGNWKHDAPCASQVKEKFGGLRFYMTTATDEMFDLIDKAESESFSICEGCGAPAKSQDQMGWIVTLCPPCLEARKTRIWGEQEPGQTTQDPGGG